MMADAQPTPQTSTTPTPTPQSQTTDDDTLVITALQNLNVAINSLTQTIKGTPP